MYSIPHLPVVTKQIDFLNLSILQRLITFQHTPLTH